MITIKSNREIELIKEASKITAETYEMLEKHIKPGISTAELDKLAENFIKSKGARPAQKGYPSGVRGVPDFPATLCISVNDTVIHGIPSKKEILKDGDVVSIDLVVEKNDDDIDFNMVFYWGYLLTQTEKIVYENAKRNNIELDFEDIKDIASEILDDDAFNDDITNHLKNYDKEQEL